MPQPAPASAFDFLLAAYTCDITTFTPDGVETKLSGAWHGRRILDGRAILDEFAMRSPGGETVMHGANIRAYNADARRWDMRWFDAVTFTWLELGPEDLGGVTVLDDGSVRFALRFGEDEIHRVTFSDIMDGGFTWRADRSTDEGKAWEEGLMVIEAKREA